MQTAPHLIRSFLPRLNALLFMILFLSALTLGPRMLNIDGDLPRHLLMGKFVLETGPPPDEEIFSYIYENRPYTPQEWLAGVLYYSAYLLLGLNGVVLLAAIMIAATFSVLYAELVAQDAPKTATFLLFLLGALVTSIHWITRPHLFTMLFLAIWIILLDRLSRGNFMNLWIFPVLMVFWANMHGEFIAGLLVLIAYIAGWTWTYLFNRSTTDLHTGKRLLLIFFLCLAASMISPAGFRTWEIVFGYVTNRYLLSRIAETRPPDFTQAEYWPLLIMLGISLFFLITKKVRFASAHFLLLAGFGLMSLLSARNAHLAGVVFPFVLASAVRGRTVFQPLKNIEAIIQRMDREVSGSILPMILTVLISSLVITGPSAGSNRFEPSVFPVEAVRWLESNPQSGRMFNAFDWGGYILLHLWPEQKTFIESHTDVTGEATQKYETVVTLQEGWQDIFEQYNIAWAIVPPEWGLTKELNAQGWKTVYQDQTAVILVRE
jgi:hypothetical protein